MKPWCIACLVASSALGAQMMPAALARAQPAAPVAMRAAPGTAGGDRAAIEAVLRQYLDVVDRRQPEGAQAAFHPTAPLASVTRGGSLMLLTQEAWLERVARLPTGGMSRQSTIAMIDVENLAAIARVDIVGTDGTRSTDYFVFLKTGAGWKITHKALSVPL